MNKKKLQKKIKNKKFKKISIVIFLFEFKNKDKISL